MQSSAFDDSRNLAAKRCQENDDAAAEADVLHVKGRHRFVVRRGQRQQIRDHRLVERHLATHHLYRLVDDTVLRLLNIHILQATELRDVSSAAIEEDSRTLPSSTNTKAAKATIQDGVHRQRKVERGKAIVEGGRVRYDLPMFHRLCSRIQASRQIIIDAWERPHFWTASLVIFGAMSPVYDDGGGQFQMRCHDAHPFF